MENGPSIGKTLRSWENSRKRENGTREQSEQEEEQHQSTPADAPPQQEEGEQVEQEAAAERELDAEQDVEHDAEQEAEAKEIVIEMTTKGVSLKWLLKDLKSSLLKASWLKKEEEVKEEEEEDATDEEGTATKPNPTTKDAVLGTIKPYCASSKLSLLEVWEQMSEEDGMKRVAHADVFVSHCWNHKIQDVIAILERVLEEEVARRRKKREQDEEKENDIDLFIWMDIFCINQHSLHKLPQDFFSHGFHNMIGEIGRTVAILTPWHNPENLTRAWCIWELYGSMKEKAKLELHMAAGEHESLISTLMNDWNDIMKHLCKIDARKAQAYDPEDLEMIKREIEESSGGFEGVNKEIMEFMRGWVADSGREELQRMEAQDGLDVNTSLEYGGLCSAVASVLRDQGKYEEAENMYRKSLAIDKKVLGDDHPDVATDLHNLASVLHAQGNYEEAANMHRESLAIDKKVHGDDHPEVAISLGSLAGVLRDQSKYEEAASMHRESLAIHKKVHGDAHPSVATSLGNLALVLHDQGKYEEAEKMHRESLAIHKKKVHGDDHPDVATSLGNLALVLRDQGKYEEAATMYRESLAIRKKVHGDDHPHVATSLNDLANVLRDQGKYEEAAKMHRETLAIYKKVHGNAHPYVATSLGNLANVLRDQGKYEEAVRMHRESLAIHKKVLGDGHPSVATSLNNVALVLRDQGKYEEAEDMHRESLAIRTKLHGEDHPSVAVSQNNLARVLVKLERFTEATTLHEKALDIRQRKFGVSHPRVAPSLTDGADMLCRQSIRLDEALDMAHKGWKICKDLHGENHPDALETEQVIGLILLKQNHLDEAEGHLRHVLAQRIANFPDQTHPSISEAQHHLARILLARTPDSDEAKELLQSALKSRTDILGPEHPDTKETAVLLN